MARVRRRDFIFTASKLKFEKWHREFVSADRASGLAGVTQTYLDQGNDLRSADGTGSNAVNFVNGPLGVGARIAGNNVTFYIRNTDGSLLEERGAPGTHYYVLGQHQSTTGLLNPDGTVAATYLYGPYGETSSTDTDSSGSAADNPWRWDGGYQEPAGEGGLYHFGARFFDPGSGRWTQPDPHAGDITDPSTFEAYSFGSDNPVQRTDKSGRLSWDDFGDFHDALGILGEAYDYTTESTTAWNYEFSGFLVGAVVGAGCLAISAPIADVDVVGCAFAGEFAGAATSAELERYQVYG